MFDPERVDRTNIEDSYGTAPDVEWVLASDYDQLLELYRKLQSDFNQGLRDSMRAGDSSYGGMFLGLLGR